MVFGVGLDDGARGVGVAGYGDVWEEALGCLDAEEDFGVLVVGAGVKAGF